MFNSCSVLIHIDDLLQRHITPDMRICLSYIKPSIYLYNKCDNCPTTATKPIAIRHLVICKYNRIKSLTMLLNKETQKIHWAQLVNIYQHYKGYV